MNPEISIITPSYNSLDVFKSCLRSVYEQSFTNWELLIIDDCSPDSSYQSILDFIKKNYPNDKRFRVFRNKQNLGPANTRNFGLRKAKGRFIAFLDVDDIWLPLKLETQLNFMKTKDIAFSYHSYLAYDQYLNEKLYSVKVPETLSYKEYIKNTCIGCLTVMLDTSKTGNIKMPNIKSSHDMALWLDILEITEFAYGFNNHLARYRVLKSSNTAKKWKAAKDVWFVIRRYKTHSLPASIYYFIHYAINAIKKRFNYE